MRARTGTRSHRGGIVRPKEWSRMEDVQTEHSGDYHGAIHDVEVQLGGDNPTIPAVDKLDGSVYRSGSEDQNHLT